MRRLEFDSAAFEDLAWWVAQDRKKALRLIRLIQKRRPIHSALSANRNRSNMSLLVVGQNVLTTNTAWYIN